MNSGSSSLPRKILVFFAVKQEAAPFRRAVADRNGIDTLITGMGARNAEEAIRQALQSQRPKLVISAGFAGGLDPQLKEGDVVFQAETEPQFAAALTAAGARFGRFHCAKKIVTTAEAKQVLRQTTGADAVEMESQPICTICLARRISCATVRVILDTANEDLPLNFNQLMTPDQRLAPGRLAWALLKAPGKIGALRRLEGRSAAASEKLAKVLLQVLDSRQ
jgi:adenosylhomocysteine nucleosidase